jgi:ligand-binding sensor domain-containing protein
MKFRTFQNFFWICFIFCLGQAFGQSPTFQSFPWPQKNQPLEINEIFQDKTGFIWYATNSGLYQFDGITYRSFTDSLPNQIVTALTQDSLGRIWVGFRDGQIAFIEKEKVNLFKPAEGLSPMEISDMIFDSQGVFWFSTYGDGIYYYVNNRLYRLDDTDGMPDLYAYDLEEDREGKIWVGTDAGVALCSRVDSSIDIKIINYTNGLPDVIIRKIVKAKNKTMLLATEDAGLIWFDTHSNKYTQLLTDKWDYGSIVDLIFDDELIWVATTHDLVLIDLRDNVPLVNAQSHSHVTALCRDVEGGIWIGSQSGVQRTMGKQLQFFEPDGDKNILTVTVGKDHDIWYSTTQGLFRRSRREGKLVNTQPLLATPFRKHKVISLYADYEGFIWAGFYGEGVIRINPTNNAIRDFSNQILNGNVVNISGRDKTVWLATLGGASEIKMDANFLVTNYNHDNGLATDYLYQVFIDSKGRVWFATDREGIDMLDEEGFHHFKDNLTSHVVLGLAEDSKNQVWANVQNEGLFIFKGDKFEHFVVAGGLHNHDFSAISSGPNGEVMAFHPLGIDVIDVANSEFHYLSTEDANAGQWMPNLNATVIDKQGSVFVGMNNGLMLLHNFSGERRNRPIPLIEQFEVNGKKKDWSETNALRYNQNFVKIGFTGFWYQNPTALTFSYKLENFDQEWTTTDNRSVIYSKLPPGEYSFLLRVSDSKDFSNARETRISFVVNPPFWNTSWFYVSATFLILFLAYSILQYRERKLVKAKHELEFKVAERTIELIQKGNEIKLQAEEIRSINNNLEAIVKERTFELEIKNKALEDYAFINAHKLRAPVASILGIINLMKRIDFDDDDRVYLEHLHRSSRELDAVVRSITQAIERGSVAAEMLN